EPPSRTARRRPGLVRKPAPQLDSAGSGQRRSQHRTVGPVRQEHWDSLLQFMALTCPKPSNLLFQLSSATLGRSYPTACLPKSQPAVTPASSLRAALGCCVLRRKRYPGRFYPTRLATRATSGRLDWPILPEAADGSGGGDGGVQPCRCPSATEPRPGDMDLTGECTRGPQLCRKKSIKYWPSTLVFGGVVQMETRFVALVALFTQPRSPIPSFWPSHAVNITAQSVADALSHGITARQLLAHPQLRQRQLPTVLPPTVCDQMLLWERERRNRFTFTDSVLYEKKKQHQTPIESSSSSSSASSESSDLESFTCPVCLSVMACSGDWCSLVCPLCRRRLSVWMRRARNPELLVNQDKWRRIQQLHPRLVEVVEAGGSADNGAERRQLAQPGELQAECSRAAEEAASLALIRRLRLAEATATAMSPAEQSMAEDIALADVRARRPACRSANSAPSRLTSDESSAIVDNRCRACSLASRRPPTCAATRLTASGRSSISISGLQAMPLTPTKPAQFYAGIHSVRIGGYARLRKSLHRPKATKAARVAELPRPLPPPLCLISGGGRPRRLLLRSASVQETASTSSTTSTKPSSRCLRSQMSVVVESPAATAGLKRAC
uniref:General transcription factor IIH subunit 4 n=1 Tax=Macrostomum lignano TaxID=282301 RepID=A0A1I8JMX7_9PLAT